MMQFLHCMVPEASLPAGKRTRKGVLLLFLLLLNSLTIMAQEKASISMNLDQARITEAMEQIESSTSYRFFYDAGLIDQSALVSVKLNNASLEEALKAIFSGKNISWELEGRFIVLKKAAAPSAEGTRRLKGTVSDDSGEPLYGVTIFIKGTTTGIISGLDGQYEIDIPAKGGQLVFRYIGMQEEEITIMW